MKAYLTTVRRRGKDGGEIVHDALLFVCPGCAEMIGGGSGLHSLPVNTTKHAPSWTFDGNLEAPTLSPSILSYGNSGERCHSFIEAGRVRFLPDSTHRLAGQTVDLPDLPDWATEL